MLPLHGKDEVASLSGDHDDSRHTEQFINQIGLDLLEDGREQWSRNPRLYLVLRDMNELQLMDELIEAGIDDTWLPIKSESTLDTILPPLLHSRFILAQRRICVR